MQSEKIYTKEDVSKHQDLFFKTLYAVLMAENIPIMERRKMSDGTWDLTIKHCQFGRVKFSQSGHSIQILYKNGRVQWKEKKTIQFLLSVIPKFVDYIKQLGIAKILINAKEPIFFDYRDLYKN